MKTKFPSTVSIFKYSKNPGDDTFRHFEAMLDFSRRNGINVVLLISPVHETYLRKIENEGKSEVVEKWKQRLSEIVRANAVKYNANAYPLWDFAYRNSITTEVLPAENNKTARMRWFWDSNHYKEETGDIVLRRVLGRDVDKAYNDFGRKLVE